MSKHRRSSSDKCCYNPMMHGYGNYGMGGYPVSVGYGGVQGSGAAYGGWGIRWIYALLVLIVIVLQFGRSHKNRAAVVTSSCCDDTAAAGGGSGFLGNKGLFDNQLIDNSVLFIIVVFLLILCAGCWTGGSANYGTAGFGGGYGY